MRQLLLFLLLFQLNHLFGQNENLCYEPVQEAIKSGQWEDIDLYLDSMYIEHSSSILVPFTLDKLGRESFEMQDFDKMYKYAGLMLDYDYESLKTEFNEETNTKWGWYTRELPKKLIYSYGHFYMASVHLQRNEPDSCLIHLAKSDIENYIGISSKYRLNVTVGMHKAVMRSLCYNSQGNTEQAIEELIPYLFLDDWEQVENFNSHSTLVDLFSELETDRIDSTEFVNQRIISHNNTRSIYSEDELVFAVTSENDSIKLPSGWDAFNHGGDGHYIRFNNSYVPIVVSRTYLSRHKPEGEFQISDYLRYTRFYQSVLAKEQ